MGMQLGETQHLVSELQRTTSTTDGALSTLQEGLRGTSATVEIHAHELGRVTTGVGELRAELGGTNGRVVELMEAQKMNDTLLTNIQNKLNSEADKHQALSELLQTQVKRDIADIRGDLNRADLSIKQLHAAEDMLRNELGDQKEQLRLTCLDVNSKDHCLKELQTCTTIIENRVADNTAGLRLTQVNLEDLNTATLRLFEDHEATKVKLSEGRESLKKAHQHVKQVHNRLHTTAVDLRNTRERLDMHATRADALRQNLQEALSRLQSVTEGNERANSSIHDLKSQLDEVGAATDAVKAGLKESNNLLLPNIQKDSSTARQASFRHGSLLLTGTLRGHAERSGGESARDHIGSGESARHGSAARRPGNSSPTSVQATAGGSV
jgi:chromosome segregation ATPase